jgi:hypothetical protein
LKEVVPPLEKEKKNPLSTTTLDQFAPFNKNNNININNHHGVDVSMILLI